MLAATTQHILPSQKPTKHKRRPNTLALKTPNNFKRTKNKGVEAMLAILDAHQVPRAAFVAHSFGTFFLSRLHRLAPARVAAAAFVDPVCMCMWSGHLVRAFVYAPHENVGGATTWWIARDIHAAAAVARKFYWSDYNLWPDEVRMRAAWGGEGGSLYVCLVVYMWQQGAGCCALLLLLCARSPRAAAAHRRRRRRRRRTLPHHRHTTNNNNKPGKNNNDETQFPDNCLVVLSGQDDLVPARHVESMVRHETDAKLMVTRDDRHAAFLFNLEWQRAVVAGVADLVLGAGAGGKAGGGARRRACAGAAGRRGAHGHSDSALSLSVSEPALAPGGDAAAAAALKSGEAALAAAAEAAAAALGAALWGAPPAAAAAAAAATVAKDGLDGGGAAGGLRQRRRSASPADSAAAEPRA